MDVLWGEIANYNPGHLLLQESDVKNQTRCACVACPSAGWSAVVLCTRHATLPPGRGGAAIKGGQLWFAHRHVAPYVSFRLVESWPAIYVRIVANGS